MRVLVADAHPEVRWALRTAIREEPGLTLIGEVSDSEQLMREAQVQHPDVILLEWELPGQSGEDVLAALGALNHGSRVIVLSRKPEVRPVALAAGAEAFVSKPDYPEALLAALRRLARE